MRRTLPTNSRRPAASWRGKAAGTPSDAEARERKLEAQHGNDLAQHDQDLAAICRSEHRYEALADNIDLGVATISRDYKILSMNAFLCKVAGKPKAALLGTDCFRRFQNHQKPCPDCPGRRAMATGRAAEREATAVPGSSPTVYVRVQAFPTFASDGSVTGFIEVVEDVTDRERAEAALRQSEQRQRAILNSIPDPAWLKDTEARFLAVNEAWCRFAGRQEREVIGKKASEVFAPEVAARLEEEDLQVVRSGKPFRGEECLQGGDGRSVWFETLKVPFRADDGAVAGTVGIARDLTIRKRLEEQFIQAQKMEAIGRLAGGIAHDFRNQLTVIKGFAEMLLRRGLVREEGKDKLQEILKATERSTDLTGRLLAFSRKRPFRPQPVELCERVAAMAGALPQMIGEDIRLTVAACEGPCWASLDPGQFDQAIMNLAANSRDAMPGGGQLRIEVSAVEADEGFAHRHPDMRAGPMILVTVSDDGCGMSRQIQARIFEPFFTTKEAGKGTGLGLPMVWGFVKQSGGAIEVQSEPGQGTTLRLYFHRSRQAADRPAKSASARPAPRGGETVLVVEDDPPLRSMLSSSLRECGYVVVEASDARQALKWERKPGTRVDLLLTDVVMPGMGGTQLAAAFRRRRKHVPILYVSGHADGRFARENTEEAAHELMIKPFTHEDLANKVRHILDTAAKRGRPRHRMGGRYVGE
jgi:PAS domain S-box-containing protein